MIVLKAEAIKNVDPHLRNHDLPTYSHVLMTLRNLVGVTGVPSPELDSAQAVLDHVDAP